MMVDKKHYMRHAPLSTVVADARKELVMDTEKDQEMQEVKKDMSFAYTIGVLVSFLFAGASGPGRHWVGHQTATGFSLIDNDAAHTAVIAGLLLVIMQPVLLLLRWSDRVFHLGDENDDIDKIISTVLATTLVGACFAAAESLDSGWFLLTGVVVGVITCIFALRKLDGVVSAGKLFVITGVQLLALFLLLT